MRSNTLTWFNHVMTKHIRSLILLCVMWYTANRLLRHITCNVKNRHSTETEKKLCLWLTEYFSIQSSETQTTRVNDSSRAVKQHVDAFSHKHNQLPQSTLQHCHTGLTMLLLEIGMWRSWSKFAFIECEIWLSKFVECECECEEWHLFYKWDVEM